MRSPSAERILFRMTERPRIEVHLDYLSPYAYLAWTQLPALAARHDAVLVPVPTLFAALLEANGTRGPAEVPRKRTYLMHDVSRSAAVLGVPLAPPPAHPFRPLLALRTTLAAAPGERGAVTSALFAATWGGGAGCETEEAIARALAEAGIDAAPLLVAARTEAQKTALREATDRALARGAFGVPTMFAEGEMFFGLDSLPHLERLLAGDARMRIDPARVRAWEALPSSVTRSGATGGGSPAPQRPR